MDTNESIWKSQVSYIMLPVYLGLFGGLFILAAHNGDFPQDIFKGPYIPLDNWIVLTCLLVILILVACGIFKFLTTKYALYEDSFVIRKSYMGEVSLALDDLQNWQYRKSRGGRSIYSDYIVLAFKEKTVRLDENSIFNLSELVEILKDKYAHLETSSKSLNTVINAFSNLLFMALCVCPCFLLFVWGKAHDESKGTNVHHLTLRLSDDPRFIIHTHKRSPDSYILVLSSKETDDFRFIFNTNDTKLKEKVERMFSKGDTVSVDILEHDFTTKISREQKPTFLDKHLGWRQIEISTLYTPADTSAPAITP